MADNVTLNAGSGGAVIATDDDGTAHHQYVKLEFGADNTQTKVTSSVGLPVGDAGGSLTVDDGGSSLTVDGTVSVTGQIVAGTAGTPSTDVISIQGITSMTAVKVDGSAVTQPVSLASVPSHDVTNAGTFAVQIAANSSVNVAQINGVATTMGNGASGTGVQRVTIANDSTGILAAVTNVATIGTSVTPGTSAAHRGKAEDAAHSSGDTGVMALGVRAASPTERSAGPTDGDYEPFATNEVGAVWTTPTASANGGLSIFRSLDIDETEEDVKTSAGTIYGMWVTNTATSTRFVKFYNATAANVTVGTTTPVITIGIPGNSSDDVSGSFGPGGIGIGFSTAICVAATTAAADNDTGAPSAGDVIINVFYK